MYWDEYGPLELQICPVRPHSHPTLPTAWEVTRVTPSCRGTLETRSSRGQPCPGGLRQCQDRQGMTIPPNRGYPMLPTGFHVALVEKKGWRCSFANSPHLADHPAFGFGISCNTHAHSKPSHSAWPQRVLRTQEKDPEPPELLLQELISG